MKKGTDLQALAAEIVRQRGASRDLVTSTELMMIDPQGPSNVTFRIKDRESVPINGIAHGQIAEHTKIPKPYYDRMLADAPDLLANNINTWFAKYPAPRMARLLDNRLRGFLSNSYRPLDNTDLAEAVFPALFDLKLEIMSCELTERRLYIKAVDPRIKQDVPSGRKIGDGSHVFFRTLSPGIVISNSEVGYGALALDYGVFDEVCTNLATISKSGMRRAHLGGKLEATDDLQAKLSDETRKAKDKALWLEVRDTVKLAFDAAEFEARARKIGNMAERPIEGDPVKVIELARKKFDLTEVEGTSVLKALIAGADLTQMGFYNAITQASQTIESYDRATELEYLGGRIIDLPANDWKELAKAA